MTDRANEWIASGQIRGDRDEQEDFVMVVPLGSDASGALAVLCDGMGGQRGGALASETAASAFQDAFDPAHENLRDALTAALEAATDALARHVRNNPYLKGLGTTLVAAHIAGDSLHHISVGDSILWLVRNGVCRRLNEDHSIAGLIERLRNAGRDDEADELADHPANALDSALTGVGQPDSIDLPEQPTKLQDGDVVVLASDGVWSLDEAQIASLLEGRGGNAEAGVAAILDAVAASGLAGQDNASVIAAMIYRRPQKD